MPQNNHFTQANHSRYCFLRLSHLFSVVILLNGLVANILGQVAIPILQLNSDMPKDYPLEIHDIEAIGEQLFLGTIDGLGIISKDGRRAKNHEYISDYIPIIQALGEQLFVATGQKLLIVSLDGKKLKEVEALKEQTFSINIIGEQVFVNTKNGLRIVSQDGMQVKNVQNFTEPLQDIQAIDDYIFFYTEENYWIINKDGTPANEIKNLIEKIDGNISRINLIGEQFYVGTNNGLWIVHKDGKPPKRVKNVNGLVTIIKVFDEHLIVQSNTGLWIVSQNGEVDTVENIDKNVHTVEVIGESLFIATFQGLWIIRKGEKQAKKVENVQGMIETIDVASEQLFVTTNDGLWIVNQDGTPVNKIRSIVRSIKGEVAKIKSVNEYRYILVFGNLSRIDLKTTIKTNLTPTGRWASIIKDVLSSDWLPSGEVSATALYSDESGKDPYDETIPKEFSFAKAEGDAVPSEFSTQKLFRYEIGWGKNDVHYWVKDGWGNTFEKKAVYYGVPSQNFLLTLLPIFSAFFVLGCFALAPKVSFCHSALMNPLLRKYVSLGSVPLLVSIFPSLRRYILRRYSNSVGNDKEFTEWKTRFVSPDEDFLPENFGKKLNDERRLLLTGQSGIGKTSFFKYLTAYYVSTDKPPLPAKVFPVYISLTNYGGNSLEELIYHQLFSYGKITDRELAQMFWEQGGLLIFFDGVNEVQNVSDRQKLSEFVKKYWTSNYICLSSQQIYPEIDNIPKVELKTFSAEKVREFIRNRVADKESAKKVIESLTDGDYQLYSVPRDLEFAVDILNDGKESLPKSRTELYKTVFSFMFAKWKKSGRLEAEYNLCEHAYTMIAEGELAFDSVDNPKFKEITSDLFEQQFLIKREQNYNFRHDLIRSYLASEYFYPRWQNLFADLDGKKIDSNWLEMLKFSCENIEDSKEVKGLVYEVFEKSIGKDLVRDLFKWLKTNHPNKCESWEHAFKLNYSELDLK